MASEQLGKLGAAMNGAAVPQQLDLAAELTQQQQQGSDFKVAQVIKKGGSAETEALPLGPTAIPEMGETRSWQ